MYTIQNVSKCDVSTIMAAPPSAGAEVSVGGYQLIPSPFVNITVEKNIVNDTIIGGVWKIQLNGTVTGSSFNEVTAGCNSENNPTNSGKTYLKKILELSRNSCCVHVIIKCGCDFIDGYGRILSASINEGNDPTWVTRGSYTIEIELYNNKNAAGEYETVVANQNKCPSESPNPSPSASPDPCAADLALKDLNESFSISVDEDTFNWGLVKSVADEYKDLLGVGRRHIKVAFSINAKGIGGGGGGGDGNGDCFPNPTTGEDGDDKQTYFGLAAVEKYMKCRIDKLKNMDLSGISGLPNDEIVPTLSQYYKNSKSYLDFRSLEINPVDQSMNLTGDIIYRPAATGCNSDVFTSINVEESVDSEGSQITISGSVEGLAEVYYNATVNTKVASNLIACTGTGLIDDAPLCDYNAKMDAANDYFTKIDDEEVLKSIATAHCTKPVIVVKCVNESGEGELLPCISESPQPTPSLMCGNIQLISRQVSRDYAAGTINFTFVFTNKEQNCSSIEGVSSIDIEATHDLPRDNIVETVVPGRGKKGVLIQNLCCLSADRWSFTVNFTLSKSKKLSPTKLRNCARAALKQFIEKSEINPDPYTNCWFVTDHQENLGNKSYKYTIQFTKPSC